MRTWLAAVICLMPLTAGAQESVDRSSTIRIVHSELRLTRSDNVDLGTLSKEGRRFDLRPDVTTRILVIDPNPLLFTYSASAIAVTPSADYSTFLTFAQTLAAAAEGLGTAASTVRGRALVEPESTIVNGLDFRRFAERLLLARQRLAEIPSVARASFSSHSSAKARVAQWELPGLIESLRNDFKVLEGVADACTTGGSIQVGSMPELCDPAGIHKEISVLALLGLSRRTDVATSLDRLARFNEDVAAIDEPKMLVSRIGFDARNDQRVVLTVGWNAQYVGDDAAFAARVQPLTGEFPMTFRPYAPARFSVGAAFVYSFVKSPTFTAVRQGDAFIITESSSEFTKASIGAMLGITPRKWDNPVFGGQIQLGIAPESDRIGFFVGAGIKAGGLFEIGGGAAFQQVDHLADSLRVGQFLTTSDELKTEKRFSAGPYLFISVTLPR